MLVFVVSLLVLQYALALPTEEKKTVESDEWVPSREAYARDFEHWFGWVPSWKSGAKKTPSIKERIQTLELRQRILYDLVRCESYGQTDCSPFRTQAEYYFETQSRDQISPTKKVRSTTTFKPPRPGRSSTPPPEDDESSSSEENTTSSSTTTSTAAPTTTTATTTTTTAAPTTTTTTSTTTTTTDATTTPSTAATPAEVTTTTTQAPSTTTSTTEAPTTVAVNTGT